jgi:cytochrome c-type biogenesis protein CcmE
LKKGKLLVIIVLPALFLVLMAGLFTENISPYISVTELKTDDVANRNVQVYGDVLVDSIHFDKDLGLLSFDITDGDSVVQVQHRGMVSNLQNATEVVAIGEYIDGVFQAEKVLVKCPSKYQELVSEEG